MFLLCLCMLQFCLTKEYLSSLDFRLSSTANICSVLLVSFFAKKNTNNNIPETNDALSKGLDKLLYLKSEGQKTHHRLSINVHLRSKCFLKSSISFKERTKTCRITVKKNSFIRFWKNSRLDNLLSKLTDL